MCQVQSGPQRTGDELGCMCGCCGCGCGPWPRRFVTLAEEKEKLERYKDSLRNELAGLEERLKELQACSKQ